MIKFFNFCLKIIRISWYYFIISEKGIELKIYMKDIDNVFFWLF